MSLGWGQSFWFEDRFIDLLNPVALNIQNNTFFIHKEGGASGPRCPREMAKHMRQWEKVWAG